jgi:hypothetical protein
MKHDTMLGKFYPGLGTARIVQPRSIIFTTMPEEFREFINNPKDDEFISRAKVVARPHLQQSESMGDVIHLTFVVETRLKQDPSLYTAVIADEASAWEGPISVDGLPKELADHASQNGWHQRSRLIDYMGLMETQMQNDARLISKKLLNNQT